MKTTSLIILLVFFIHPSFGQALRLVLPIGHTDYINQVRFSPDGKTLLTGSSDKTAKLWDAATGYLLADLAASEWSVDETRYSFDGKKILTRSDASAQLWDAGSGKLLLDSIGNESLGFCEFYRNSNHFIYSAFDTTYVYDADLVKQKFSFFTGPCLNGLLSKDNKLLVTMGFDDSIRTWNVMDGSLRTKFFAGKKHWHLSFGPDERNLLLEETLGSRMVWDIEKNKPSTGPLSSVFARVSKDVKIVFSGDRSRLALVNTDSVIIHDSRTGNRLFSVKKASNARIYASGFLNRSDRIVTIESFDIMACKVKIWDLKSARLGKPIREFIYNNIFSVQHLEVSVDDRRIYLGNNAADESFMIDPVNGNIITQFNDRGERYYSAEFNTAGDKLITTSTGYPRIWDRYSSTPDSIVGNNLCFLASFSPSDQKILLGQYSSVWLLDPLTNKKMGMKTADSRMIRKACFSPDGSKVLFFDSLNRAVIWNTSDFSIISRSRQKVDADLRIGNLSADGNKVIGARNDSIFIWDAASWEPVRIFKQRRTTQVAHNVAFSHDGTKFLAAYFRGDLKIFDLESGKALDSLHEGSSFIREAKFSRDDKKIVFVSYENRVGIYNIEKQKKLILPNERFKAIASVNFSADGKFLVTASDDHTCRVWDTETGILISTFFSIDKTDYFTVIPSGYYQTTQAAARLLHYVTPDLKLITFDQLDVKYNRPDKVLEAIGNKDTALINSYRKAWQKRISKLGIDTTQFREGYSVPEADFMDRDSISYEQKSRDLVLRIKGRDSSYLLDRMNIWVNESPVFGQKGISLKDRRSNYIDTVISIRLSQGENRIETSIISQGGTESYRAPLIVNYSPAIKRKEITHFIGIGIDHFARDFYNLQYSTKDISDLALALKAKYGNDLVIDTLFNQKVNRENIRALKKKLASSTEDDRIIISYSGHGLLSREYEYFLSTYNIDFKDPAKDGLPYQDLEDLLDSIPARRKLMLIDACNSGEVDKEAGITMKKLSDSLGLSKGGVTEFADSTHIGLKNSFELMQSIFINVGRSTGATIISAAAGNQFALERDDLRNGVFTFCLLEALKKYPEMMISRLKTLVAERVLELTKGLQQPTYRKEMLTVDWKLW